MRTPLLPAALLFAAACSNGGNHTTANTGNDRTPELVLARSRVDNPYNTAELALRTAYNLGTRRLFERLGREYHVRVNPDGNRVVFARELGFQDETSREIYVTSRDGSTPDTRLTQDRTADDGPCWSPDGNEILWSSAAGGARSLWRMDATGGNQRRFLVPLANAEDRDPDWCAATNTVAFSRRDADGRQRIWLVQADGIGDTPLTTGLPPAGFETGDREPTFAPDGSRVVFVRMLGTSLGQLWTVDVATRREQLLFDPQGEVHYPRFSPRSDRIFCGASQPLAGRSGRRLLAMAADGSDPVLVLPDKIWQVDGIDLLPSIAPVPTSVVETALDVQKAQLQFAAGSAGFGGRAELAAADNRELALATTTFDNHEIAAINVRYDVPVATPDELLTVRVRAIVRASRVDGDCWFRLAFYNPVTQQFETVVEMQPTDNGQKVLSFSAQSNAHLTQEKQLRVTVIGQLGAGARAEFDIDMLDVRIVHTAP